MPFYFCRCVLEINIFFISLSIINMHLSYLFNLPQFWLLQIYLFIAQATPTPTATPKPLPTPADVELLKSQTLE